MNEDKHKKEINFLKAKVFFKRKLKVHVSMGGTFYNGMIAEKPEDDFFFLDDRIIGRQLIFFSELTKPIEEFKEGEGW